MATIVKLTQLQKDCRTTNGNLQTQIDKAMRHACIRGIKNQDRIVFWMHKNKLTQLRALNKAGYYAKLANDKSRWAYRNEIKVDI